MNEIADDASIYLAAHDMADDINTYLWPINVYQRSYGDHLRALRREGMTHDAELLAEHLPVMDDGVICGGDHDRDVMGAPWHHECPVVRSTWPGVTAAFELACEQFKTVPKPGEETS